MTDITCPLSIIIVNWNTRDLLAACLRSLTASDGMPDGTEVIVVDNASADDSVSYLRTHAPWVQLISHPVNSGFAAATNVGLAIARGEHLLLLNSDTEVHSGALEVMVAFSSGIRKRARSVRTYATLTVRRSHARAERRPSPPRTSASSVLTANSARLPHGERDDPKPGVTVRAHGR